MRPHCQGLFNFITRYLVLVAVVVERAVLTRLLWHADLWLHALVGRRPLARRAVRLPGSAHVAPVVSDVLWFFCVA